jgi:hypothetical protein
MYVMQGLVFSLPANNAQMPGRVILDHLAFVEAFPELKGPLHAKVHEQGDASALIVDDSPDSCDTWEISSQITLPHGDLWTSYEKKGYSPTPAQALLCPALSPGYSVAHNDWGYFDIDLLEDLKWSPEPLKELEIDFNRKEILKDLIMDHQSKSWSNETVPGKGEGLIFLLYGPPGCGKTLTAGEYPL